MHAILILIPAYRTVFIQKILFLFLYGDSLIAGQIIKHSSSHYCRGGHDRLQLLIVSD